MIKKLKRKFIFISMLSVSLVLILIIGLINVANYTKIINNSDHIIDILIDNGGKFDDHLQPKENHLVDEPLDKETPFETRYFVVIENEDGTLDINCSKVAKINQEQASSLYTSIKKSNGTISSYRYKQGYYNNLKITVFLDYSRQYNTFLNFLIYSILISCIGLLLVFLLVIILTKIIMKPVIESYNKQKHFITNASHELKTPLTIISTNNELIEIEYGENDSSKAIENQISKMNKMVKNLTLLSKLDENDYSKNVNEINLSESLIEISNSFKNSFKQKNIKFETNVQENVFYKCDTTLMSQLFNILLDNALKYSSSFFKITLTKTNSKINLSFINDCDEIDENINEKVFDRFFRSTNARSSNIEGSGIGLSIAKEIVTLHKGEIHSSITNKNIFEIKIKL